MYQFDSRIRYSEVDADKMLTWGALLNYFQDCSVFHSQEAGRGFSYLEQRNLAWVLLSWQIHLQRMPSLMEHVWVQTWPYERKAFYGYRNFRMIFEDGTDAAYADSVWALMDTESGRPVKIPEDLYGAYGMEPPLPMESCGRKLTIPKHMDLQQIITVPKEYIDTNRHMNNERYVTLALAYVSKHFQVGTLKVEYRKEARLGDTVQIMTELEEDKITVVMADEKQNPYAIVVFNR